MRDTQIHWNIYTSAEERCLRWNTMTDYEMLSDKEKQTIIFLLTQQYSET